MERLIPVFLRLTDPIAKSVGMVTPLTVERAECGITVSVGFNKDSEADQISDFAERRSFLLHLLIDTIDMLCSAVNIGVDASFFKDLANLFHHFITVGFTLSEFLVQELGNFPIFVGIEMLECEILKPTHDTPNPQSVCDRRVNLQCIFCDALAFLVGEELQRLHVMKSISEFNEDDPHIFGCR